MILLPTAFDSPSLTVSFSLLFIFILNQHSSGNQPNFLFQLPHETFSHGASCIAQDGNIPRSCFSKASKWEKGVADS